MLILYTKAICPFCTRAKAWLQKHDIPYEEIDISNDDTIKDMLRAHGHKTIPQLYLDGEVFVEGGYEGLSQQDPKILKERIAARV